MTIGLTFRQLLATFTESLAKRSDEFDAEMMTAEVGVNPKTKRLMELFPMSDENQSRAYIIHLMALLDTMVSNNDVIAKSLPPQGG